MTHRSATKGSMRCAVYARVSSDMQDVENSLGRQERACRAWADKSGHVVLDGQIYIDEAKSGASMLARPAFQKLLSMLRGREPLPFDCVLVDDDSRLDRGGHMAAIVEAFTVRGVALVAVDSGRDMTDENERLLVHVKSGLNEHYLHELARRTREGLASKVLHGFHAGGRTYGYRLMPEWPEGLPIVKRDRDNRLGTRVEVDPEQARVVRTIFERYADGAGFRSIAAGLNAAGILSSRGKPSWDSSAVRAMLLNPRYVGDWSWNRRRWQKTPEVMMSEAERERARQTGRHPRRPSKRPAEDLVQHHNEALRIVADHLWEAVQARFSGRSRTCMGSKGYQRTRSPIAGLITCSCGGSVGVARNRSRGHVYARLFCARHRTRGPSVCDNATVMRMEAVATPLMAFVRGELLSPDRVARLVDLVNEKIADLMQRTSPPAKVNALEAEITTLQAEVARLVDALARGTAYDTIAAALAEKDTRLKVAKAELEALTRPLATKVPKVTQADARARLGRLYEDVQKLDSDRARVALKQIFDSVVVRPLRGAWENGWRLEMKTRPWAVVLPRDAVAHLHGCGGGI